MNTAAGGRMSDADRREFFDMLAFREARQAETHYHGPPTVRNAHGTWYPQTYCAADAPPNTRKCIDTACVRHHCARCGGQCIIRRE